VVRQDTTKDRKTGNLIYVLGVGDGPSAILLRAAREGTAPLGGLDLLVPEDSGVASRPAIMVTAYGDDETAGRQAEYGAADLVTKPVNFDLLKQHLQQLSPPLQRKPV
jgi:CheY-like chemotaxis protein